MWCQLRGGWSLPVTISTSERYDPSTDTWEEQPDMPTARDTLAAVVKTTTKVEYCYAIGGEEDNENETEAVERRSPAPAASKLVA